MSVGRDILRSAWFTARLRSIIFLRASLNLIAWLATALEIPVLLNLLLTRFSYGYAYTGIIARGFALEEFWNLLGLALIIHNQRRPCLTLPLADGLGLATETTRQQG